MEDTTNLVINKRVDLKRRLFTLKLRLAPGPGRKTQVRFHRWTEQRRGRLHIWFLLTLLGFATWLTIPTILGFKNHFRAQIFDPSELFINAKKETLDYDLSLNVWTVMFANHVWVHSVHLNFMESSRPTRILQTKFLLTCKFFDLPECAFVYHIQGQAVTQYLPSTPQRNLSPNPI